MEFSRSSRVFGCGQLAGSFEDQGLARGFQVWAASRRLREDQTQASKVNAPCAVVGLREDVCVGDFRVWVAGSN